MLALFKSKPLLDEQEQQWLIDTFVWAVENFDSDYFINNSQLVLPNHQCFPDAVSSIEEMASKVFERVVGYAGLQAWPITLVAPQQLQPQVFPHFAFSNQLRGDNSQLILPPNHTVNVSFNQH